MNGLSVTKGMYLGVGGMVGGAITVPGGGSVICLRSDLRLAPSCTSISGAAAS